MRATILGIAVLLTATACGGRDETAELMSATPPPMDAPQRKSMPEKCNSMPTFDEECSRLFDEAFGRGVGSAERSRLITEHAYSGGKAMKRSTATPAPVLGEPR